MKKPKLTTKPPYKNGYEAAQNNSHRRSPHRDGTTLEGVWLAGYDAYIAGGPMPETPRKKRTKAEMHEARINPPVRTVDPVMLINRNQNQPIYGPRAPRLLEKIFAVKNKIKVETDPETLELLHMELADYEWTITGAQGSEPTTVWDAFKIEHGLDFERTAT